MPLFKVCKTNDISQEKAKKFIIGDEEILVAKSSNNCFYAFSNMCNHADKPLENGKWNAETAEITCPFHKAIFSIRENGAVKKPPAFVSLSVYPVTLIKENKEEFLFVEMDS